MMLHMDTFGMAAELVIAMVGLLLIAAVVLAFCKRFKLPFTVMLVLVGIGLGYFIEVEFSPELVLYVCLPTLIFESASHLDVKQLQRNLIPVLALAIPGLIISTFVIGLVVSLLTPLSFIAGLVLGAILSATDPVAVISIFKKLGVPKRLTVLVEGESLLNDATAIVLSKILFAVMMAGAFQAHLAWHGAYEFFAEFIGGAVVGWGIAVVTGLVLGKVERDSAIEISLTTILAYGSYIIAQDVFHVSGVMAVLAAGLTMSRWGRAKISPTISTYLESFWSFLAYVANALVFLLVGLSVNIESLYHSLGYLIIIIVAMLVSRAIVIYSLIPFVGTLSKTKPIDRRYQTVMYWGGLRGAIALAIVLSLQYFDQKELFVALVMGSVLFTLLVQGVTIEKLVKKLGLDKLTPAEEMLREQGRTLALETALKRIPELQVGGHFSETVANELQASCSVDVKNSEKSLEAIQISEEEETRAMYLQCFATEKKLYYKLFARGHLAERTYRSLIDLVEMQFDIIRFENDISQCAQTIEHQHKFRDFISKQLAKFSIGSSRVAENYEEFWGQHQGAVAVLNYLNSVEQKPFLETVKNYFEERKKAVEHRLDLITEQFPEFVMHMQERLASRLFYFAELEAIREQADAGYMPSGIKDELENEILNKLATLREKPAKKIKLSPVELLKKVPFCHELAEEDFGKITPLLRERIVTAGEVIIKQGDKGDSLFLIMRGVIRVIRDEKELATLMAGEFFGEVGLLHHDPRTATCQAVTPGVLYELRSKDFETLKISCPSIQEAVERADEERRKSIREI